MILAGDSNKDVSFYTQAALAQKNTKKCGQDDFVLRNTGSGGKGQTQRSSFSLHKICHAVAATTESSERSFTMRPSCKAIRSTLLSPAGPSYTTLRNKAHHGRNGLGDFVHSLLSSSLLVVDCMTKAFRDICLRGRLGERRQAPLK